MYLLFLDESGAHSPAPVFVLGGIAVHEHDAFHLQRRVETGLTYRLAPLGLDASRFELHAKEIKQGAEEWASVPINMRFKVLGSTYQSIATYGCIDPEYPCALFGAVVDSRYKDKEQRAYELVLNKFDEMLDERHRVRGTREAGLVVHDRRMVDTPIKAGRSRKGSIERRIQMWTRDWQELAGKVGRLHNFADVPLFADSKATRLIQVADFVCWALWRYYSQGDTRWMNDLWGLFHSGSSGPMHGLIHVTPDFARKSCTCPPCKSRLG